MASQFRDDARQSLLARSKFALPVRDSPPQPLAIVGDEGANQSRGLVQKRMSKKILVAIWMAGDAQHRVSTGLTPAVAPRSATRCALAA